MGTLLQRTITEPDPFLTLNRICPGRWLAGESLFMTIASVLHTLEVKPILGPSGVRYDPFAVSEGTENVRLYVPLS